MAEDVSLSEPLFPAFLKLKGRKVLLVGGGPVAQEKLKALRDAGARVTLVAPHILPELLNVPGVTVLQRPFEAADLDGVWFCVSAAPAVVNHQVAQAAESRALFVNAVDDPASGSAYLGGVVRKAGVTVAVSTDGKAPALAGLLREALDTVLPEELAQWTTLAQSLRSEWRTQNVPLASRRPLLLQALNQRYALRQSPGDLLGPPLGFNGKQGFVWLVGAGPGDPELLTRRASRVLADADLVLYDALVSPEILALAPNAHRFYVGKRARRKALAQETLNQLLVRAASRGQRVVRLKCGDPFVFGRGGEEALALAEAGIPFEVVPGITSAISAPALAGIPVTHRGISSAFTLVSGHAESAYRPVIDSLAPHASTLVVLMGLANRGRLASYLVFKGWRSDTPAAVLWAASTGRSRAWVGRLDALGDAQIPEGLEDAPATLCIGEVVRLSSALSSAAQAVQENSGHGRR